MMLVAGAFPVQTVGRNGGAHGSQSKTGHRRRPETLPVSERTGRRARADGARLGESEKAFIEVRSSG
jgi:hypothetical protein